MTWAVARILREVTVDRITALSVLVEVVPMRITFAGSVISNNLVPGAGLLHLGSTACSGNPGADDVSCSLQNRNEVRLMDFDAATNSIVVDFGAIFAQTDLSSQALCHSAGLSCGSMFQSLGVDFSTGDAMTTQSVYRVE